MSNLFILQIKVVIYVLSKTHRVFSKCRVLNFFRLFKFFYHVLSNFRGVLACVQLAHFGAMTHCVFACLAQFTSIKL